MGTTGCQTADSGIKIGRLLTAASPAASFDDKNCFSVKGKKSETVVVGGSDVSGKDVSIGDLTDCRVHVLGSPSTLHATGLSNCTLLCGPVSSSSCKTSS